MFRTVLQINESLDNWNHYKNNTIIAQYNHWVLLALWIAKMNASSQVISSTGDFTRWPPFCKIIMKFMVNNKLWSVQKDLNNRGLDNWRCTIARSLQLYTDVHRVCLLWNSTYSGIILEHTDMSKQNHNLIPLKDRMFLWENKGGVIFHQTELALNVTWWITHIFWLL